MNKPQLPQMNQQDNAMQINTNTIVYDEKDIVMDPIEKRSPLVRYEFYRKSEEKTAVIEYHERKYTYQLNVSDTDSSDTTSYSEEGACSTDDEQVDTQSQYQEHAYDEMDEMDESPDMYCDDDIYQQMFDAWTKPINIYSSYQVCFERWDDEDTQDSEIEYEFQYRKQRMPQDSHELQELCNQYYRRTGLFQYY